MSKLVRTVPSLWWTCEGLCRRRADDLREKKIGLDTLRVTCKKRVFCGFCPGFFELETGDSMRQSPYLCAIGHARAEMCEATNGEQQ